MAVELRINAKGIEGIQRALRSVNPKLRPVIQSRALKKAAFLVQVEAADKQIVAGGGGKNNAASVLRNRLTSRTGTLRRSIRVDQRRLPRAAEIGTDLRYGAVHEIGGAVKFRASTVKSHTRTSSFGRKTRPFTVPSHSRKAYTANYPKRPFLKPALDKIAPQIPGIFIAEIERAWKAGAR